MVRDKTIYILSQHLNIREANAVSRCSLPRLKNAIECCFDVFGQKATHL